MADNETVVTLRTLAERVGLAPCSVSSILNNTAAARAIPQHTKDRVFRAAEALNYRPNLWARSLRTKRTRLVAAITVDIGQPAVARVISGAQKFLHHRGYMLALVTLNRASEWNSFPVQLRQQGVEALIAIDAIVPQKIDMPVASVDVECLAIHEPVANHTSEWLVAMGESAAAAVLRQLESKSSSTSPATAPELPGTYFSMPNERIGGEINTLERA